MYTKVTFERHLITEDGFSLEYLDNALEDYIKTPQLNDRLANYLKTSQLQSTLEGYTNMEQLDERLANYIKNQQLNDILSGYLKSPLESHLDFASFQAQNTVLHNYSETIFADDVNGDYMIDCQKANVQELTVNANSIVSLGNPKSGAFAISVKLTLTDDYTIDWQYISWPKDEAPTLEREKPIWLVFLTTDGVNYQGFIPG